MKDLDQFIDEQLFKNSKTYKLIYETVIAEVESNQLSLFSEPEKKEIPNNILFHNKDCQNLEIPLPENVGVAGEYLIFKYLMIKLLKKDIKFNIKTSSGINYKVVGPNSIQKCIGCFIQKQNDKEKINKKIEAADANAEDYISRKFSSAQAGERTDNYFLNLLESNILEVNLIGQSLQNKTFQTSGDIEILTKNDSTGEIEVNKFSVKDDSKTIFKMGKPVAYGLEKQDYSEKNIFNAEGGGIQRLYQIFGLDLNIKEFPFGRDKETDKSEIANWNFATSDFETKINEKLKNTEEISKYFSSISNMVSRGDESVFALISLQNKKTIYPRLLNKYLSNIKEVVHKKTSVDEAPESSKINAYITKVDDFNLSVENLNIEDSNEKKVADKLISKTKIENVEKFKKFLNVYESLTPAQRQQFPNSLENMLGDYEKFVSEFSKFINDSFKNLTQTVRNGKTQEAQLLAIRAVKDRKKYKVTIESRTALFALSNIANIFETIEKEKEFSLLAQILDSLFDLNNSLKQTITQPSVPNLFETLILEALNEKEHQKVMKKIMSSGAKGLISAIPSNKTNNSIAVRFDSEDTIDAGIKKVKSSLRSAGYQLDDKRVLKFDQDRDTTDVIKNGEIVGRLFYRVDVKERKGLAYEHILGAVLTGKITDQLKNRIDLGPDASKEDVMSKLNSEEFKPLYDSAKKAAPIIKQKVGNIVKAESVGSTNNKADFVLTTGDGKTVGLSAKYAAGEKDNEYKMNKVLGFGTEDDSLVLNPDSEPWWVVGRKTFLEKLKSMTGNFKDKTYDPDYESLDAPSWMVSAKEKNPDVYKETMEEVYGKIRNILTKNLKRMRPDDLLAFVREADVGKDEENEGYDMFIKVKDGPSGLSVTDISLESDSSSKFNPQEVVTQDRSDIIIQIPGMEKLTINSVKFKSDMLSSKAGDLKIKTR